MITFETVWNSIKSHHGETFVQICGGKFSYAVSGDAVIPDRTNRNLPRSQFEEAFSQVPLTNTTATQHLQGPSYIYAILMDKRVRASDR